MLCLVVNHSCLYSDYLRSKNAPSIDNCVTMNSRQTKTITSCSNACLYRHALIRSSCFITILRMHNVSSFHASYNIDPFSLTKLKCIGLKELYYSFPNDNKLTPVNHLGLLVMRANGLKYFVLLLSSFLT